MDNAIAHYIKTIFYKDLSESIVFLLLMNESHRYAFVLLHLMMVILVYVMLKITVKFPVNIQCTFNQKL